MLACVEHGHTAYGDDVYCASLNVRTWDVSEASGALPPEEAPEEEAPPRLVQDISLDRWEDRHG